MAETTPMMKQYRAIKERTGDCILFYRLGDFYEMFAEDACLAAKELDLTLTTRDRSKDEEDRIPMCGVPYHSAESYIARLVAKGYKVAICEQTEDPATAKGLVSRDITRIITPGTVIDSSMLDEAKNNFICSVNCRKDGFGMCFCDMSTGEIRATRVTDTSTAVNEIGSFLPAEAVITGDEKLCAELYETLKARFDCHIEKRQETEEGKGLIERHFDSAGGLAESTVSALGALLAYLHETQMNELSHINRLYHYTSGQYLELDLTARRNLEITETMRGKSKKGSLLWVLDKTKTPMGGRLIRTWLDKPLQSPVEIRRRLTAVDELKNESVARSELMLAMRGVSDMERLIGRIVYGSAGGRDMVSLSGAIAAIPQILTQCGVFTCKRLAELAERIDPLDDIKQTIDAAIVGDPPFSVREGGIIRDGYDSEVDRLRGIMNGGKSELAAIEASEKEKTGIRTLKVGYNRVFGYYIEVSRGQSSLVPDTYIRKQTLTTAERYITPELKELESTILTAGDRITALEYELFTQLRTAVAEQVARIQQTAGAIAELDVLCSLAEAASLYNYCMPEVDNSQAIEIKDGRHPVVERMLEGEFFVPNDTAMDVATEYVDIITGPNMAGKSTYMRQVALITLMAQIGSFVPARAARIGVVDRIFTRIGASDDLSSGRSTFMVEMTEVAQILKNATSSSLLILDEIGRGTSTYDGTAIARAVLEHTADKKKLGAKTLFATHYHELTELEGQITGVRNFNIAAKKRGDDIIFLRKIVRGGADDSYGIEVARLAGVPDKVIKRAKQILQALESGSEIKTPTKQKQDEAQMGFESVSLYKIAEKLDSSNLDTLTPIEAMNLLYELKKLATIV